MTFLGTSFWFPSEWRQDQPRSQNIENFVDFIFFGLIRDLHVSFGMEKIKSKLNL